MNLILEYLKSHLGTPTTEEPTRLKYGDNLAEIINDHPRYDIFGPLKEITIIYICDQIFVIVSGCTKQNWYHYNITVPISDPELVDKIINHINNSNS